MSASEIAIALEEGYITEDEALEQALVDNLAELHEAATKEAHRQAGRASSAQRTPSWSSAGG